MSSTPPATAAPAAPSKTSVIFAGEIFDGSDAAHPLAVDLADKTHEVRVRAMPARHLQRVVNAIADEHALLSICCQLAKRDPEKPAHLVEWIEAGEAWVENLSDESHLLLVEAAKRQNFSRAAKWGQRQIEAKTFQAPLLQGMANDVLRPLVKEMALLLASSLVPAASPGGSPTKS